MHYDGTIHVKSGINVNHLKELSKTTNYLYKESGYNKLAKQINNTLKIFRPLYNKSNMLSFSNLGTLMQNRISDSLRRNSFEINKQFKYILSDFTASMQKTFQYCNSYFWQFKGLSDKCLYLKIADEIGFPIYLEMDSDLQHKLIGSYIQNGNQCNKKEMCEIILDYYNDECVDHILNGIKNVQVFNSERVILIEEGIEAYQLGFYGSSASLFAAQLSGMIKDVYNELIRFHRISYKEKNELLVRFNQNCRRDSEKGMLLQIIDRQSKGFFVWDRVLHHFLDVIYSTKENDMDTQPNRNMICHGKQTNYNTKEMNLKLILCMDIIAELAWRVKQMKEEYSRGVFAM